MNKFEFYLCVFCFVSLLRYGIGQVEENDPLEDWAWKDLSTEDPYPSMTKDVLSTAFLVVATVGLSANTVVFFVIFCGNEIAKTITALYVLQLAIADSLFLVALLFFAMQQLYHEWGFGAALCAICQTIKFLNYYAGIFFLTAMSIDRYIAVAYSTKAHQLRTKRRALWACLVLWIASALASLPAILYSRIENINGDKICRVIYPGYKHFNSSYFKMVLEDDFIAQYYFIDTNENNASQLESELTYFPMGIEGNDEMDMTSGDFGIYSDQPTDSDDNHVCDFELEPLSHYAMELFKLVFGFIIPFLIISCSYIKIIHRLRKSENKLTRRNGTRTHTMRKRVTRMVSALVVCFAVCWLPYHIYILLRFNGFYVSQKICYALECFVTVLGYANSAFNPILYTFLGHDFRQRLTKSIHKTRRRLSIGSKPLGSGILAPSRKSSQRSRSFSMRPTNDQYLQIRQDSGNISAGCCPADFTCVLTRNQSGKDGKNIPLLELRKNTDAFWKCEPGPVSLAF